MSATAMLFHRQRESNAERARRGRAIGRARAGRSSAIQAACLGAVLAIELAFLDPTLISSFAVIGMGALMARLAVRDHRRADALLARGVRAGLAEGSAEPDAAPLVLDGIKLRVGLELNIGQFRAIGRVEGNLTAVNGRFGVDPIPPWATILFVGSYDYALGMARVEES